MDSEIFIDNGCEYYQILKHNLIALEKVQNFERFLKVWNRTAC